MFFRVLIYHLENAQSRNLEGVLNALFGSGSVSRSGTSATGQRQGIGTNVSRTGTWPPGVSMAPSQRQGVT